MFVHLSTLSAVPTGVVDVTQDFTSLLLGLVVGLCLCVLAVAIMIGVYDSWWSIRQKHPSSQQSTAASAWSDAA